MSEIAGKNNASFFTNPYITDGLVEMWDGERNNAHGNCHNPDTTEWKGLVHGTPIIFTDRNGNPSADFTICDNYYDVGKVLLRAKIKGICALFEMTNAITFELVCMARSERIVSVAAVDYYAHLNNYDDVRLAAADYMGNAGIISHQTTAYYPDGTARAFTRNMTETNGLVTAARRTMITTDDVIHLLGEKYPYADFTANGNIYCMRLYSRGLMEAEMRQNFEVDKARFGI